ncbi:hypothetical protein FS083_08230, partial [Campylobacter jejuni]|nr:hypothetical protein [Campylobacter jejuni]
KKELSNYNSKDYFAEYLKEIYFSIPPKPRKVFISKEIKERTLNKKIRKTINKIEYKLKKGEDVNPFLSKRLNNNDKMFSSFGIHHFHLGEYLKNKQEYDRTGDLLYCFLPYYNNDSIYFIDVLPHKQWCNQELFDIIQKNWSDALQYTQSFAVEDISEKYIKKLRKNNINFMPSLKSGEIVYPNFGYMYNGDPAYICLCKMNIRKQIEYIYKTHYVDIDKTEIIDFELCGNLILKNLSIKNKISSKINFIHL